MKILKEFSSALAFFTILPLKKKKFPPKISFLPLVGWIIGGIIYSFHLVLSPLPHWIESLLLLWIWIWFTGGMHLEGLTDTFDAVLSRRDRETSLKIMKDPSTGVMGIITLLTFLSLKFLGLYFSTQKFPLSLLVIPVLSRFGVILIIWTTSPAKKEGLGYLFWKEKGKITLPLITIIPVFFLLGLKSFPFLIFTIIFYYLIGIYFKRKWEGFTGDNLGMAIESGETFLLFLSLF